MIEYLTLEQILEIHTIVIKRFGGLEGVRDSNLLLSAVESPKATMFGDDLYPTVYDKAAVYLFQIIRNHPFNDGNKRTGSTVAYLFLQINKKRILFTDEEYESFIIEIAKGNKTKEQISYFLEFGSDEDNF